VRNVVSFYNDHDELYWDVNGDQWQQPFTAVTVVLHLPPDVKQSGQPVCYTGSYGSTARDCLATASDQTVVAKTLKPLAAGQTLTYVVGFDKGYFQPAAWYERWLEYQSTILKIAVPAVLIGGGSLLYWWRRGRDASGRGIIVPQYEVPNNLKPLAVGLLADFKVDNRDISAMIIDLAVRGYIKIIETKDIKALQKDVVTHQLELRNADQTQLDSTEKLLMNSLFDQHVVGDRIDLSALKHTLYSTAERIRKLSADELTAAGYFRSNPLKAGRYLVLVAVLIFAMVYIVGSVFGWQIIIGLISGGIIALLASYYMPARTAKGVAAEEHIKGLKLYLEVAEKDRLEKLQGPDADYAPNAAEPVKTVQLFEKLLPFAMVLGVEERWAKQFEGLYTQPPEWYTGHWSSFSAYYLASSLNSGMSSAINTAFSAPRSSGSSGFGGGGFSGGGGGGGGGGGW